MMISVIIPTLNAAATLPGCLAALVPAAMDGTVREVIVADACSTDGTCQIADDAGCTIVQCATRGRGPQLAEGARKARQSWLLFLHADTMLEPGWTVEAEKLFSAISDGRQPDAAAAFRFALDDPSTFARLMEAGVALRCRWLKLPFGDQGLLISRRLYDSVGGYPQLPLMEDVALIHAIPRRQRFMLPTRAVTSADRYRADGYLPRVFRNWCCLAMYVAGLPIERIVRIYAGRDRR